MSGALSFENYLKQTYMPKNPNKEILPQLKEANKYYKELISNIEACLLGGVKIYIKEEKPFNLGIKIKVKKREKNCL